MAKIAQKYFTDLNNTRWNSDAHDQFYGGDRVRREYYNDTLIYNNALYQIILPDLIEVEAPGGQDALNIIYDSIDSRKTDVDGTVTTGLEYKITPEDLSIPPNTKDEPIYGTFTVTQQKTNLSIEGKYMQNKADLTGVVYSDLSILNVYYDYVGGTGESYIPASGGTANLCVEYQAKRTLIYSNTIRVEDGFVLQGTSSTVTVVTGGITNDSYTHVSFSGDGTVSASSLKDTVYYDNFAIAKVTKLNLSVTFVDPDLPELPAQTLTCSWNSSSTSSDVICYQHYNQLEKVTIVKSVFTTSNVTDVDPAATTVTVPVTSYRIETYTYTSGYTTPETEVPVGGSISATSSGISVSPSNWGTSTQNLSVSVPANTNASGTKTYYVTISNGSTTITSYITQNKDYVMTTIKKNIQSGGLVSDEIPAKGGILNAVQIWVTVKYDVYNVWASQNQTFGSSTQTDVVATSISGNTVSGTGGTITGTKVYANSRGTTYGESARAVFTILTALCTFDSTTVSFSGSHSVMQSANTYTDGTKTYYLTCNPTSISFDAKGGTETITVNSYLQFIRTYESTSQETVTNSASASISSSNTNVATPSIYQISGTNKTFDITVSTNSSTLSTRSATINLVSSGDSSKKASVSISQEKDYLVSSCTGYVAKSISAEEIPASGGSSTVQVTYSTTCYNYSYATGEQVGTGTTSSQTVNATSLTTSVSSNIGTASGGSVYASSRGKVTGDRQIVYTVSGGATSLGAFNLTGYVYQESNEYLGETTSDSLSISKTSPSGNVANTGGNATFAVSATYSGTADYTSGSYSISGNNTASISATSGYSSLSPTSITGTGNTTLTLNPNYTGAKTYTVTAKVGSTSKTASVTQNAVSLVITPEQTSLLADSAATTVSVVYTSTINGSANPVTVSSNQTWATVGTTTSSGTTYTTIISLTKNTSTTDSRTVTITLSAVSGTVSTSKTVTITQDSSTVQKETRIVKYEGTFIFKSNLLTGEIDYTTVLINGADSSSLTRPTFSAPTSDDTYSYTGGTFEYQFIVSSTKSVSDKITETTKQTITVDRGSSVSVATVSIPNTTSAAVYVLIPINGTLHDENVFMIEQPAPL